MFERALYRVVVTDNLVCAIQKVAPSDGLSVARSELEGSTQLSRNNLENGRLDGVYYFEDAQIARQFAVLCLDFVKRLVDKTLERIEARDFAGELECENPVHGHG